MSWRPWIAPPAAHEPSDISDSDRQIIGECLRAAAFGPFFVDNNADEPYWEFPALFGFNQEELAQIAREWPNVDHRDEYVGELIAMCAVWLTTYPHRQDNQWASHLSISKHDLCEWLARWNAEHRI